MKSKIFYTTVFLMASALAVAGQTETLTNKTVVDMTEVGLSQEIATKTRPIFMSRSDMFLCLG